MPSYFIYVLALFTIRSGPSAVYPEMFVSMATSLYVCRIRLLRNGYGVIYHRPITHPRMPVERWEAGVLIWQDRDLYRRIAEQNTILQDMVDKSYQRGYGWKIPDIGDRMP